jgi:hypothetical protein
MAMASSTSQSDFWESLGMVTLSLGPVIELVAFVKMMGSLGSAAPDSAA